MVMVYLPIKKITRARFGACAGSLALSVSIACGKPPRAGMEVQVTSGGVKPAEVCPDITPGSTPRAGCEPFQVTSASKIVVTPGDAVAIRGKNFRPSMTVAAKGAGGASTVGVTVMSDTQAALLVPESTAFGLVEVTLTQEGVSQKLSILSNGGKTDLPVITAAADQICKGMKYYDLSGTVQEGKKDCAAVSTAANLPMCQSSGQVNCVTTNDVPSVVKSSIDPTTIRAGTQIVGVVGTLSGSPATCSLDGETGCLANVAYPAVEKARLVGSNIRSGIALGGVTGTMAAAPGDCTVNGSRDCVARSNFYAAQSCVSAGASGCFLPNYVFAAQPLVAADLDAIDASKIRSSLTIAGRVGSLSDCASNGLSGCVTTSAYKSADLTNLSPGNIKNGVQIAGTVGTYPSATAHLATNTAAADLTSVSPTTATGTYEFFDSTGAVHTMIVADGGTVAPSSSLQPFSAPNTFYRAFSVAAVDNAPSSCTSNGAQYCIVSGSFYAGSVCSANGSNCYLPGYAAGTQPLLAINYDTVDATQMRAALTIAGKSGSLADCGTDGALGCVTVAGYPSAKLANFTAGNVQSGVAIAGVSGTLANCSADGTLGCVTVAGYPSAKLTNFTAGNVQSGTTIAGVSGSLTNCSADGGTSCVATGTYTAAATAGLASKVLSTATVAGVVGNVTLPTVNNVFLGIQYGVSGTGSTGTLTIPLGSNVRTGNGIYGVGGNGSTPTLADCSTDGSLDCVTVAGFPSAKLINFTSANVQSGTTIAGISGSLANCATDGGTGCVAVTAFKAVDMTKLTEGVIKNGTTIASVAGLYPSSGYKLTGSDGTVDLPAFASTTGGSNYQWFQGDGTRLTGTIQANQTASSTTANQTLNAGLYRSVTITGDANLTAGNIKSNTTILGVAGNYGTTCATDGAQDCMVSSSSTFKAANVSGITAWDIRAGKTLAAIGGSLVFYKNMANTSVFNRTSGTGAAAGADIYDTIDDYNANAGSPFIPQTNPWGGVIVAPGSNWTTVTAPCDGSGACVLRDETTGLLWAKADTTTRNWENAISYCAGLNYGGYSSGWRLPSQKELMQAYVDGIWTNKTKLSLQINYYWSSSTLSDNTSFAWIVLPNYGLTTNSAKTTTTYVLCVR